MQAYRLLQDESRSAVPDKIKMAYLLGAAEMLRELTDKEFPEMELYYILVGDRDARLAEMLRRSAG